MKEYFLKKPPPQKPFFSGRWNSFGLDVLHLTSLSTLFILQPILSLLSETPEFLTIRRVEYNELIFLVALLLSIPLGFALIEGIIGFISISGRRYSHLLFLSLLFSLGISRIIKFESITSGTLLLFIILLSALILGIASVRLQTMRLFLTFLSPGIIVVPILFFINPTLQRAFIQSTPNVLQTQKAERPVPIVMIIFDEFPITSLLDNNLKIDETRFPNFSFLQKNSHWFRNATSVSDGTELAVPAILTGRYPKKALPTFSDHPENLFTLLAPSYEIYAEETVTELCPQNLCPRKFQGVFSQHFSELVADLVAVYLTIVVPANLDLNLPNISQSWGGFWSNRKKQSRFEELTDHAFIDDRSELIENFIGSIRSQKKPTLHFLHVLFPHYPWKYLPSGKIYTADYLDGLLPGELWGDDEWATIHGMQRHLLQVQYLDSLIGKLISHLKEEGLFDESLIIITADHGVSFQPGDRRRPLTQTNYYDILPVPLFFKLPFQNQGEISDRNVQTIDILPSIADALKLPLSWKIDGVSAWSSLPAPPTKHFYFNNRKKPKQQLEFDSSLILNSPTIKRIHQLFPPAENKAENKNAFYSPALFPHLLQQNVSALNIEEGSSTYEIDQEEFLNAVDTKGRILPARITGEVTFNPDTKEESSLALSLNGVIQSATKPLRGDKEKRFAFLLPENAFRDGRNDLELFEVVKKKDDKQFLLRRAHRLTMEEFELISTEGKETLRSKTGESYPVETTNGNGALDSVVERDGKVVFSGWAADISDKELAKKVVCFVDGRFVSSLSTFRTRKDVSKLYGPWAESSGFIFEASASRINPNSQAIRLFALSKKGTARELIHSSQLQRKRKKS